MRTGGAGKRPWLAAGAAVGVGGWEGRQKEGRRVVRRGGRRRGRPDWRARGGAQGHPPV